MELGKAIESDWRDFTVRGDVRVRCYTSRPAEPADLRPLVLLHSINAAPSAMEMRPLFEHWADHRPVYAPDLPGFGHSQRGPLSYTPALYTGVIEDLLAQIEGPEPDVIALSLSSEFLVRAVVEGGVPVRSLTLISPTGLSEREPPSPAAGQKIRKILDVGWLSRGLWRALVSGPSIRYFLGQAFYGKAPDRLVNYARQTAAQPGAADAPFAFLTMQLFSQQAMATLYSRLDCPTLILYDEDPNIDFNRLPELVAQTPAVTARRIVPTRGLPHWERPEETTSALTEFWQSLV